MSTMEIRRAYSYKLDTKPSDDSEDRERQGWLCTLMVTHCFLYRDALRLRIEAYEAQKATGEKQSLDFFKQCKWLTTHRVGHPYLDNLNRDSLNYTLKRLDDAYKAFFRRVKAGAEKAGFPTFPKVRDWDTVVYGKSGWRIDGKWLVITKCGDAPERRLKMRMDRPVEGTIKTMSLTRKADGWHVVFSVIQNVEEPTPKRSPVVGIDLGLTTLVTVSDGETVANEKPYRRAQEQLARAQRSLARKQRGSQNRRDARQKVARLHLHVANVRLDAARKAAKDLCERYGVIGYEDVSIGRLSRGMLAKSFSDAGWAILLNCLKTKAETTGTRLIEVDARGTSQRCSGCGHVPEVKKTLAVRVHECPSCGLTLDRDLNAARNVWHLVRDVLDKEPAAETDGEALARVWAEVFA